MVSLRTHWECLLQCCPDPCWWGWEHPSQEPHPLGTSSFSVEALPFLWIPQCRRWIATYATDIPPLACYGFDTHEQILIFFGRNDSDKVSSQKMLYYATSNNLCFCTTWQNVETRKSHISLNWIVLHTRCTCALSSWKKKVVICDVFGSI